MKITNKLKIDDSIKWEGNNICAIAISKDKILYGAGNGTNVSKIFMIDLTTKKHIGND